MTHVRDVFLVDTDRPHTRFSAAGNDGLTTRYGDRRLKSAKARSRGKWALAGSERYGDFDISADLV